MIISKKNDTFLKYFKKNISLYVMVIPGIVLLIMFKYLPIYGIIVAFENYYPNRGVFGSQWVGLEHFIDFFNDPYFFRLFRNTFVLGFYTLIFSFPAPIILALLLNEVKNKAFKKVTQTISYMPYFLSVVIIVGLMKDMLNTNEGIINEMIALFGFEKITFFASPEWFRTLYIVSGIWQGIGFGSIIYLAAISGINIEMYEAAIMDGASRMQQIIRITLPSIMPTVVIMLILSVGNILGNDFQKILLMYNPLTYETADVISTYVYRMGIEGGSFSYASAVGFFISVISFSLVMITNKVSQKFSETSLW